jgi:hypothetical protein
MSLVNSDFQNLHNNFEKELQIYSFLSYMYVLHGYNWCMLRPIFCTLSIKKKSRQKKKKETPFVIFEICRVKTHFSGHFYWKKVCHENYNIIVVYRNYI